ncbi:hypothetical protein OSB04_001805 [Centaurea solstitialis]|uniref:CCHC-type domain-containing protein n=1 Tax=Centaurea solstitialis TaxID=347529 RepID=A0AA38TTH4_9ASTR|nr:hypothetical protein OSB04_001805 [Centaurea solstitialis]
MASTVTSTNNLSLRSILEKDKLTGSNFLDWERNLMIVLRHERKWHVLEEPLGEAPPANAPAAARNAHKKHSDDLLDVACLMLATMSPDLQAGLINTNAYDMIRQLRDMFQTQARTERYDATKAFNECKMVKGTSVSDHVMKMKRHLDHLERLGHPVPLQLATDTILNSLSEDYRPFVVNYNMNNMEKTIAELHSMLKTAELNMGNKNKTKDVLMVKDGGVKKKNGHASTSKGKGPVQAIQSAPKKGKGKGKGKKVKPNKARTENRCFICNEIGHWRQNCPKRHEAGSYDQLLNNSYKCCRLKVAQIFDRVANIGRDPRLRLLLGNSHKIPTKTQQEQVHELQVLVSKLNVISIPIVELFQVGAIIAKLPPSWKDFSKRMMHKSEDFSLDDLMKHLRIEEETRIRDKRGKASSNVHHVSGSSNQKNKQSWGQNKVNNFGPKKQSFKRSGNQKPKFNNKPKKSGPCHVCGETGHYARECKDRKSGPVANAVEGVANLVANVNLGGVYMISSLTRAVAARGWFVDTGATIHVCGQRRCFDTYRPIPAGTVVVCADGHRADVLCWSQVGDLQDQDTDQ